MFIHQIDEEVSLKLIEIKDAEKVFDLTNRSRQYLRKWLPWLDHITRIEDTRAFIRDCLKNYAENKSKIMVILFKGEIVGISGYNIINWSNKTAYIGYWLGEQYQGNGLMTRVVKALTTYAFTELNLNKVEIRAAEENTKSRHIPERLDYVKEGTIRQAEWLYDHYVDLVIYGMLAKEWQA